MRIGTEISSGAALDATAWYYVAVADKDRLLADDRVDALGGSIAAPQRAPTR